MPRRSGRQEREATCAVIVLSPYATSPKNDLFLSIYCDGIGVAPPTDMGPDANRYSSYDAEYADR